jgi:hypothetical protein
MYRLDVKDGEAAGKETQARVLSFESVLSL